MQFTGSYGHYDNPNSKVMQIIDFYFPGYTGVYCETMIDFCTSNPCYYNGVSNL